MSTNRAIVDITRDDYARALRIVPVGLGIDILFMPDEPPRVAHDCKMIDEARRLRHDPTLTIPGHIVVSDDPITISPSFLCDDCGLHGFVIAGEWQPV